MKISLICLHLAKDAFAAAKTASTNLDLETQIYIIVGTLFIIALFGIGFYCSYKRNPEFWARINQRNRVAVESRIDNRVDNMKESEQKEVRMDEDPIKSVVIK